MHQYLLATRKMQESNAGSAFCIGEGLLLKPCHNMKVQGWYIAPKMHQYLLTTRKMQAMLSV